MNFQQFYKEKEYIDVIFIGPSTSNHGISPMLIWDKYGIVTYARTGHQQNYITSYTLIEEALKLKKPKLIIVDVSLIVEGGLYLPTNIAQLNNISSLIYRYKGLHKIDNNLNTTMNIYSLYHERIKLLNINDFITNSYFKGVIGKVSRVPIKEYNETVEVELKDEVKDYTNRYVELAKKYNSNILFIAPPSESGRRNYLTAFTKYAKSKGYDCINYDNMRHELGIDINNDYYNQQHLNIYGVLKYMAHLVPYIKKKYNIPVRKGDQKYKSWDEDYIKYDRHLNKLNIRDAKNIKELAKLSKYDNYTLIFSSSGNDILSKLDDNIKNYLKSFGLNDFETNKSNQKYLAIVDDNKPFFESIGSNKQEYKGRMKNIVNLYVSSDVNNSTIKISGKEKSKNKYGLNIAIYDKKTREVVDSILLTPKDWNNVIR